jgi:hypothetical protein
MKKDVKHEDEGDKMQAIPPREIRNLEACTKVR